MLTKKSFLFPFYTALFLSIVFLCLNHYTLDKGLVMDDEGWYLYLLKDKPNGLVTQYYKLVPGVFEGDIYSLRLFNFYFQLLAILVYSVGLYIFLKGKFNLSKRHIILFIAFTLIGFSLFTLPVCNTPYYVRFNRSITLISIGIVLAALKINHVNYSRILFTMGGFISGFLFFVMITTSPIFLPITILIYAYSSTDRRITNVGLYIIGLLLAITYYFLFIEPLSTFLKNEIQPHISSAVSASHNENHGLLPMARWFVISLKYLLFNGLLSALIIVGYNRIKPILSSTQYYILVLLSVIAGLFFYYENVIKGEHAFADTTPFLGLFIFFIIDQSIIHKNLKYTEVLLLTIFFIPLFLSLGSDVDFKTRMGSYAGFMFPLLYIICAKLYSKRFMQVFMIIIVFYSANIFSMVFRKNWGNFNYSKQTHSLQDININQNVRLDSLHINNIKQLKLFLNKGDTVLLSNKRLWGYSYLLELKPLNYSFRPKETDWIQSIENTNAYQIKLVETAYGSFSEDLVNKIKQLGKYELTDTASVLSIYNIYTLKRKAK